MGYTLELYATRLDAVRAELADPRLTPEATGARPGVDDEVIARWPELAATVARALTGDGGDVTWPHSGYVRFVVRGLGAWYGSLWHTSSGGREFRSGLLAGSVADLFGEDTARHLVNRPLDQLAWPDVPMLGWLTNAELRPLAATARTSGPAPHTPEQDADAVWTLIDAVDRAASAGRDLVTVYT